MGFKEKDTMTKRNEYVDMLRDLYKVECAAMEKHKQRADGLWVAIDLAEKIEAREQRETSAKPRVVVEVTECASDEIIRTGNA
jgi:ferritin-like metal-binding protein YciE